MHSVLADFLRSCPANPEVEAVTICAALNGLMQPDACRDPKQWELMNACLLHAEWLFGRSDSSRRRASSESLVVLGLRIGILFSAARLFGRARTIEQSTVDLAKTTLGEEHRDTLSSINNVAFTIRAHGEPGGARKLQLQVLEARNRVLGEKHPGTLTSVGNLALTLSAQGDLTRARKLEEEELEGRRRRLGKEHPTTTVTAWNLLRTLTESKQNDACRTVVRYYLAWPQERDPATLDVRQRRIRDALQKGDSRCRLNSLRGD
jgi:hypothetical protein